MKPTNAQSPRNADPGTITSSTLSLDPLRHRLSTKFEVVEKEFTVAGSIFSLLKVGDTNKLVDAIDPADFAGDERLPYWADVWTSSVSLAEWCLRNETLSGKRVLELGCGLGLSGIAAAKVGAFVTFSDYEPDALAFAQYNARRNLTPETVASHIQFFQLDWRDVPSLEPFDVILAADVVYERRNFFPLIDVLTRLLSPQGTAVFAEPCRSIGEHFFNLLKEEGFSLAISKSDLELEGRSRGVRQVMISLPLSPLKAERNGTLHG